MRLSVIIPCYNEIGTIDRLIGAVNDSPYRDKEIILTQTLLLRDGEKGSVVVPVGDKQLPVAIRFSSTEQEEPSADWEYSNGTLNIDCAGWNANTSGGAMTKPHRIAVVRELVR